MTSSELIEQLSLSTTIPKTEIRAVMAAFFAQLARGLKADGFVTVQGIGRFDRYYKEARQGVRGRHLPPGTVPPRYVIRYSPSSKIKDEIQ